MKLKKFLCAIFALLCGTMTLTSCSNDDDEYVIYEAKSTNVSNIFIAQVAALMNNAIDKEFGSTDGVRVVLRNDWKAIEVCDEVAKEFKDYDLIDSIELTVTSIDSDDDSSDSEIIKTYYFTNNTSSSTDSSSDDTDDSENSEE